MPVYTGLQGSEMALQQGLGGALSAIGRGADIAGAQLSPYAQQGGMAFNLQAAQSGALGPEAQRQAFAQFTESPGQAYLREQGEQAVLRGASATGGLGGGRVQQELMRQGIGMAAQDYGNQFNRLSGLSQIGFGAAGQGAGIAERTGMAGGEMIYGTGQNLAQGRTRAGEQIAGAVGQTGSALAGLMQQGGTGISDILARGTGNIADILAGAGTAQGASQEQLATLLANIATGSASQRAALPSLPSLQPKTGALTSIGQFLEGVGSVAQAGG